MTECRWLNAPLRGSWGGTPGWGGAVWMLVFCLCAMRFCWWLSNAAMADLVTLYHVAHTSAR